MARPLTVFLPVTTRLADATELLLGDPATWLPAGTRATGQPDSYRFVLEGLGVERPVVCTVGTAWRSAEGCWRRLSWQPAPSDSDVLPVDRLLPSFDGELGIHGSDAGGASLVLSGTYEVPGGGVGVFFDQVALSRVARRSAERLLHDVAVHLAERAERSVA
jgi:hypothetical protein